MGVISNVKNARSNWRKVKGSPYGSLMFKYKLTQTTIYLFSAFMAWTFYSIIKNMGGSSWGSWISRVFTLLIGLLIIQKAFQSLGPMKRTLEQYAPAGRKKHINHTDVDIKTTVKDILSEFDEEGNRKV